MLEKEPASNSRKTLSPTTRFLLMKKTKEIIDPRNKQHSQ